MKHVDCNETNSPNKIFVKEDSSLVMVETGDWLDSDAFFETLYKNIKKVKSNEKYKDRPAYIIFCINDDYELNLEFWGERLETDEEYKSRQKAIDARTEHQKKIDMDRLTYLASEMGYKLVKE